MPPDYRYILIRLLDKIRRNTIHYRTMADAQEVKSRRDDIPNWACHQAATRAESLRRSADDLEFTYERGTQFLTEEDKFEIVNFQAAHETNDRSNPIPKSA